MWTIVTDGGDIIYDPRLRDFQLTSARLTQELNKADVLSFALYPDSRGYSAISRLKTTILAEWDGEIKSRCRLLDDILGWHNERECSCEGELAFFNDSIQRPFTFPTDTSGSSPSDYLTFLVERHNAQVSADRQFIVGDVTVTDPNGYIARSDTEYSTTWTLLEEGLLDALGGYFWIRHENDGNYIDYLADFDTLANQPIEAGVNLVDLVTERKGADIATAILPLGAADTENDTRLTIENIADSETSDICKEGDIVYSKEAETLYGSRIVKVVEFSDITLDSNLLTAATAELAIVRQLPSTITITAADLSAAGYDYNTFSLGTYVSVSDSWHGPHGLAATYLVQKLETDLLNPGNSRLTLGSTTLSFTESNKKALNAALNAVETNITMETATAIRELEQRNQSAIEQSEQQIVLTVSENYYTKDETNDLVSSVSTEIQQTAEGINIQFSSLQQDVDAVAASADAKFEALQSYIRMEGGNITLGEVGNEVTLTIENDKIGIYVNGVAVTYWTASDFVAPISLTIPVGGRLNLGNYAYIPRSNGSLDFVWVGA